MGSIFSQIMAMWNWSRLYQGLLKSTEKGQGVGIWQILKFLDQIPQGGKRKVNQKCQKKPPPQGKNLYKQYYKTVLNKLKEHFKSTSLLNISFVKLLTVI